MKKNKTSNILWLSDEMLTAKQTAELKKVYKSSNIDQIIEPKKDEKLKVDVALDMIYKVMKCDVVAIPKKILFCAANNKIDIKIFSTGKPVIVWNKNNKKWFGVQKAEIIDGKKIEFYYVEII